MNLALPLLGLTALAALALLVGVAVLVYVNLRLQRQNQALLDRLLVSTKAATVDQLRELAPAYRGQPAIQTAGPAPAAPERPPIEPGSAVGTFPAVQ